MGIMVSDESGYTLRLSPNPQTDIIYVDIGTDPNDIVDYWEVESRHLKVLLGL